MKRVGLILIVMALCCCGQTVPARQDSMPELQDFESQIEELLNTYKIPSVSACILKRDPKGVWSIAWKGAYGYRMALWPRIRTDERTVYPIGSITKTFTATAVMQLVDKGLVDLDEDVSTYLGFAVRNPGLVNEGQGPGQEPVTVRQLLSHRSGLPQTPMTFFTEHWYLGYLDFGIFRSIDELREYLGRKESWAHKVGDKQRYYHPGQAYCYSNVGYMMLGFIIEQVIAREDAARKDVTWKQYIVRHILEPLGMHATEFYWLDYPRNTSRAQGYIERKYIPCPNPDYHGGDEPPEYATGVPIPQRILCAATPPLRNPTIGIPYNAGGAAGQMISTPTDLAAFFICHLNGGVGYARNKDGEVLYDREGRPREVRILSKKSLQLMHAVDDRRLCRLHGKGDPVTPQLSSLTGYGLGWMRMAWGGHYWNGPWHPEIDSEMGVDWRRLQRSGIKRGSRWLVPGFKRLRGLMVEGNVGDLPGFHSAMCRVSDDLALIYLANENLSEEQRDESRMQPRRFRHFTTDLVTGRPFEGYDGAFPHHLVKYSELEYLLLLKAASLE